MAAKDETQAIQDCGRGIGVAIRKLINSLGDKSKAHGVNLVAVKETKGIHATCSPE